MVEKNIDPVSLRHLARENIFRSNTSGYCPGYTQANLVILPKKYAYDFLLFTQRNPKPCPVLEVSDLGSKELNDFAKDVRLDKDFPKYCVFRSGHLVAEPNDISDIWQDNFVSFLIGCSFSFETELLNAGIEVRNITENVNVPMYNTDISLKTAGNFHGNMVVSMRPVPEDQIVTAVKATETMDRVHGAPVHIGNPKSIGILDLSNPDYGDMVSIKENEVPVFWACGVTPQKVLMDSKPSIAITHAPGHMLVTDIFNERLKY